MADSVKLVLTFNCDDKKTHSFSYKYADSEAELSDVKALIQGVITNGSIFTYVPVSIESAKTVVTTENKYDLDD